jgi:hypothetical protein
MSNDSTRGILQEIFRAGSMVKVMKDVNGADGITFLLDSTVANECKYVC